MKYIESKEEENKILLMISNDKEWEYIGGWDGIQDGMGGIVSEEWYKNIKTNNGIVVDYTDKKLDCIRTMEAEEFKEFYNRFDGMYLIDKPKSR